MDIVSFWYFFAAIIIAFFYYILPYRYRVPYLAVISSVFIVLINYLLLPYVLVYSIFNYYVGRKLPVASNPKRLYRAGIIINLTQLIILRYSTFALDPIFDLFGAVFRLSVLSDILIPVGISYFTLQGIGYLINIKMGWEKPEESFVSFFVFITFFPKFLAGPIERSDHLLPQIKRDYGFKKDHIVSGLRVLLIGVFKKVAIANQLAPYVIGVYTDPASVNSNSIWLIFLLQPLYLYFDFSGYTDIAIGIAKMFGIDLLPNFNRPFFARNMTTFWKRFHISLSSWFNDYIFKQTVFKYRRLGVLASVIGLFIVWSLFGIWHGAGWTFMLLGFLQATAIIYEFLTKKLRTVVFSKMPQLLGIWIGRLSTYLFYCISLVFFFAPSMNKVAFIFLEVVNNKASITIDGLTSKPFMLIIYIPLLLFIELLEEDFAFTYKKVDRLWRASDRRSTLLRWIVYSIIISIIFVAGFKDQQFVYVNF
jgi:alginate O-acetyltransferase complex protein AlgI